MVADRKRTAKKIRALSNALISLRIFVVSSFEGVVTRFIATCLITGRAAHAKQTHQRRNVRQGKAPNLPIEFLA